MGPVPTIHIYQWLKWGFEIVKSGGFQAFWLLVSVPDAFFSLVRARVWLVYEWYTVVGFIQSSEYICTLCKKATGGLENQSFWISSFHI